MLPKTGWGNICWVTYPAYVLSGTVLKSLVLLVPVTLRSGRSKSSLKSAILRIPTEIDFEGFSRSKRYSWFQMTSLPLRPVQPQFCLAKSDRRSRPETTMIVEPFTFRGALFDLLYIGYSVPFRFIYFHELTCYFRVDL